MGIVSRDLMKIKFEIPVKVFKQGNSWIYFNKKYNISGYGKTKSKAKEMFLFCVDSFLIFSPPAKQNCVHGSWVHSPRQGVEFECGFCGMTEHDVIEQRNKQSLK